MTFEIRHRTCVRCARQQSQSPHTVKSKDY